jgi:integrase
LPLPRTKLTRPFGADLSARARRTRPAVYSGTKPITANLSRCQRLTLSHCSLRPERYGASPTIRRDIAAKKGSGRVIPIHPDLRSPLADLRRVAAHSEYVVTSERRGAMTPSSIVVWFNRAFRSVGLKGCSSHSGRRTFVTRAARLVHKAGGSLHASTGRSA